MLGNRTLSAFLRDTSGAVTVDWVVLSAATLGLGLAVTNVVATALRDLSLDVQAQLETDHLIRSFADFREQQQQNNDD